MFEVKLKHVPTTTSTTAADSALTSALGHQDHTHSRAPSPRPRPRKDRQHCKVNQTVEECNRLDSDILLEKIPNLGLIIDLTNTNRYYNPNVFQQKGVEHRKLMIPGHATPPQNLVDLFKLYVLGFLKNNKNNDKLIGVHCTHGVNRTGYLICNYMISEMTVEPRDAINRFRMARGHKIERENYLQALYSLGKPEGQNRYERPQPEYHSIRRRHFDERVKDRLRPYPNQYYGARDIRPLLNPNDRRNSVPYRRNSDSGKSMPYRSRPHVRDSRYTYNRANYL